MISTSSADQARQSRELYLDLLKRSLLNFIYPEAEIGLDPRRSPDPRIRFEGRDWPPFAHTMVGWHRLENLQRCAETILLESIPGDFLEAGVWRGGASILLRGVLKAYCITDRRVWAADSFAGLPPPDPVRFPADAGLNLHLSPQLAVSLETVRANFSRYGLLDDQVRFLRGWFRDTLPTAPVDRLALLRLDGDLYESTWDALTSLYPKVSPGGFVIVDDYGDIAACRQAVNDYRRDNRIEEPIVPVDWTGVFWRRALA
jgi:O-methyltransferase